MEGEAKVLACIHILTSSSMGGIIIQSGTDREQKL